MVVAACSAAVPSVRGEEAQDAMFAYVTIHLACFALVLEMAARVPLWPDEVPVSPRR